GQPLQANESIASGASVIISRVVLCCLASLLTLGLWYSPPGTGLQRPPGNGDLALFQSVVSSLRTGGTYYPTMERELRNRNYPTASLFNWRLPAVFVALAHAPRLMRAAMILLAMAVLA